MPYRGPAELKTKTLFEELHDRADKTREMLRSQAKYFVDQNFEVLVNTLKEETLIGKFSKRFDEFERLYPTHQIRTQTPPEFHREYIIEETYYRLISENVRVDLISGVRCKLPFEIRWDRPYRGKE